MGTAGLSSEMVSSCYFFNSVAMQQEMCHSSHKVYTRCMTEQKNIIFRLFSTLNLSFSYQLWDCDWHPLVWWFTPEVSQTTPVPKQARLIWDMRSLLTLSSTSVSSAFNLLPLDHQREALQPALNLCSSLPNGAQKMALFA